MSKYVLEFTTKIHGHIVVEADSQEEAEQLGEEMATDTVNYDEMERSGYSAPDVETEFDDLWSHND